MMIRYGTLGYEAVRRLGFVSGLRLGPEWKWAEHELAQATEQEVHLSALTSLVRGRTGLLEKIG